MKKVLFGIIIALTLILGVTSVCLIFGEGDEQANAASSNAINYGFFVANNLVTSDKLSGEWWSYDPKTQVLTLGEEGKSFSFDDIVRDVRSFDGRHTFDGKAVSYAFMIQPAISEGDYDKETPQPVANANRPKNLKIVVKGDVRLGNPEWSNQRYYINSYNDSDGNKYELYDLFGGIMWNGDIEISGGGNLQIRSHAYGINSKGYKITFTDVTVGIESYGNCLMVGDMTLTNATVTNRSTSLGGYGRDESTKSLINDSVTVVSSGTIRATGSYLSVFGTYNRNNTTEPGNSMQGITALSSRPIYLFDSTIDARAYVGVGWKLYCKDSSGEDLGGNIWVRALSTNLHLYDGAYVNASVGAAPEAGRFEDWERVDYVGISGEIRAYGNAGVCSNSYEGNEAASAAISGIKWSVDKDNLAVDDATIYNNNTEYEIGSYYLNTNDAYYEAENRYKSQYSVNINFWKKDILYLRYDENDKPQASWNRDFKNPISLQGNTISPEEYPAYDGKPCSIAVMSGEFNIILPKDPEEKRYYIAYGGHLVLQMKDGANYGTIHVKSSEYYRVTIEGNGTIEYLDGEESKYAFVWSPEFNTMPYRCGGSLTINGGTIKKCKVDGGYVNRVDVNSGNVDLYGSNLYKRVLDFKKIDGTVDVQNGGLSLRNIYTDLSNVELFDGILYLYTRNRNILGGIFNYVYVQSEDSYNYYVLPVEESILGNTITYEFQRFEEKWVYEPGNSYPENKKIYAKPRQAVTIEGGQFVKQVYIEPETYYGFYGIRERIDGTETRELPDDVFVRWYVEDSRTGGKTRDDKYTTLDYQIDSVTADHEYYSYICEVHKRGEPSSTLMGEFRCDMRVMVMGVRQNAAYVNVGDTITLSAMIDKNDRDDWRDNYAIGWQVDKGDGNGWVWATDFYKPNNDYQLAVDSEEMFNWKYRAYFYQVIKPIDGPSLPEYASSDIPLRKRGTPKINPLSVPDEEISGENKFIIASLENAYTSATTVYWEYSEDNGESWATISKHPNLGFVHDGFRIVGVGFSWTPSYYSSTLIVDCKNSLDGVKVRCVINDFQQNETYYSDVHTFSVIQIPEIYIQSEGEATVLETESALYLSCWMYGGTSNTQCLQQWQKNVKGSDNWIDVENQTGEDFLLGDLTDDAQTTYYRCKLTYKFLDGSHDDIIRYSKISTVNVVHAPVVNDDVLNDNLLIYGQEANFNIDFTANADYPYSVQWQASSDGINWEDFGEAKLDTDLTSKKLTLSEVESAGIKYFRAKVVCAIGELSLDSKTKAVKLYMAKPSQISVDPEHFTISDDNPATITITDYCPNGVKPVYEWQFRKNGGAWRSGSELGIESDTDKKTLVVGNNGAYADEWRCLVTLYLSNTDISAQCYTNELSSTYFTSASFISAPNEETLWAGRAYNYVNIKYSARENDCFQLEISRDNGKTWLTFGDLIVNSSNTTIENFDIGNVNSDMDGCLLRVVTYYTLNGLTTYGRSPSVKITVKTGNVSTAKDLLEAVENKVPTIKLTRDITISQSVTFITDTVFDLNGYILKYQSETDGNVIRVETKTSVTIIDSHPMATHIDKTIPLGGIITGGTGSVCQDMADGACGGGVFVNCNAKFVFSGGTIYKCIVQGVGGGIVSPYTNSVVIIDGGIIDGCEAKSFAGGIFAKNLTINGGIIKNCKAPIGGGIVSLAPNSVDGPESKGMLTLNGGTIEDCSATDITESSAIYCDNIYANGGSVYGKVVVIGNIQRSEGVIDRCTAFYFDVTCDNSSLTVRAGLYYATINAANFNGAVKVTFKNGDKVYATLVLAKNERAFAPSELCGSLSWYNGEALYDFSQAVSSDITLRANWDSLNRGHSWSTDKIISQVDSTCESAGSLAHWYCELCNKNYAADKSTLIFDITIEALGHTYGEYAPKVNPTCNSTGYCAYYECSVCHKLFDENKTEKTSDELIIAIDPNGHLFGEWQTGSVANCATEGELAHRDCTICNKHFDSNGSEIADLVIAKNDNHLPQSNWLNDENGHWHVCTRDGCKDNGKINRADHIKNAEEATELIDVHCTICGYVFEDVKPHTHDLKLVSGVDKTCTDTGVKSYYVCSYGENPCGKYYENADGTIEITDIFTWRIIPAGHIYSDLIDVKAPTCNTAGWVAHYECSACSKWFDENKVEKNLDELTIAIDPDAHKFGEWIVESKADCENAGVKAHKDCEYCGKHFDKDGNTISTVIPSNGHTYGDIIAKVDATCSEKGNIAYYHCSLCDKYFNEAKEEKNLDELTIAIDPDAHKFGEWIVESKADCENAGVKAHKDCEYCGKHFDKDGNTISTVIPSNGHTYGDIIAKVDATCSEKGNIAYYHCSLCDKYFNEAKEEKTWAELETATTDHKFGEWIDEVPPSVDDFGIKGHKDCTICNKHFDSNGNELDDLQIDKLTSVDPIISDTVEADNKLSGGAIAGITTGSVAVAGIGGFSIFWFLIEKKGLVELGTIIAGFFKKLFRKK